MKRVLGWALAASLTLGGLVISPTGLALAEPAAPAASDGSAGATQALNEMMSNSGSVAVAATPGAPAVQPPPVTFAADSGGAPLTLQIKTASCAPLAAKLAAGEISSYDCTTVRPIPKSAQNDDLSGGLAVPSGVNWPAACRTSTGTLINWTAVSRRAACNHISFQIATTRVPSGEVIGTTNMHAVSTMIASTTGARWAMTTDLWVFGSTGVGFPSSVSGNFFPRSGCTGCVGRNSTWNKTASASWAGTSNLIVENMASGATVSNVWGSWQTTLNGNGWGNPVVASYGTGNTRCDNRLLSTNRPAGCVIPNIPGVAGFSQSVVPQFVQHVYGAQMSGLPGRLSTNTYLTKLDNSTLQNQNGNKACPSSLTRPATGEWDCDEYPFRSTYQGASTGGGTQARSLSWCQMPDPARTGSSGWSRCFINRTQNRSAGATLVNFYRAERIFDTDPFQVGYLP